MLAVIGPRWRNGFAAPRDGPDYVRIELRQAFSSSEITVIPVLVQGATLPASVELPADVAALDHRAAPAERITPERVCAYVADLSGFDASATILSRLQELYDAAVAFDNSQGWQWIRRIAKRVRAQHVPARSKRERMVHACDLLQLGETLMAQTSEQPTTRLRAMQFRDGLIIALLAARPLRLRNLAGLELDRTLTRRGEAWWIAIPPEETKTHAPIEAPWPDGLAPSLESYLHKHRPVLCGLCSRWTRPVGMALWVSTHGSPMTNIAIYDVFTRRTAQSFGTPINPHLFRDCAATSIAIHDPAHVGVASQLLGHFLVALRNGTVAEDIDSVLKH